MRRWVSPGGLVLSLVVAAGFVIASWVLGSGIPYYIDSNETYLSYVHAANMVLWDPRETSFLTSDSTDSRLPPAQYMYTHNPNLPRYVHYLLLLIGISPIQYHIILISFSMAMVSVFLAWLALGGRSPGARFGPAVGVLVFATDYPSFLSFSVNTYRVIGFVLFWLVVLVMVRRSRLVWIGAAFFLLLQYEYGFAIFAAATAIVASFLIYGRRSLSSIAAAVIGSCCSLAVFAIQVINFLGTEGFYSEVDNTINRRGPSEAGSQSSFLINLLFKAISVINVSISTITERYGYVVAGIVLLSTIIAIVVGILHFKKASSPGFRSREESVTFNIAALYLASLLGLLCSGSLLNGYFMGAFISSALPIFGFSVALACATLAGSVESAFETWHNGSCRALRPLVLVLPVIMIVCSYTRYYLPYNGLAFAVLEHDFHGQYLVAPGFQRHLVFSLTGGHVTTLPSSQAVTPGDLKWLEAFGAGHPVYYACLDLNAGPPVLMVGQVAPTCAVSVKRMETAGHELVRSGPGFSIFRIRFQDELAALGTVDAATLARDAQRKADLRELAAQLEQIHQTYGRYPCTPSNGWQWSRSGPGWLVDVPASCGAQEAIPIPIKVPLDPLNEGNEPWVGGFIYGYRGYRTACPESANGQYFVLVAQLENPRDPDASPKPKECTGEVYSWPDEIFAITNQN